jgi:gluconolactonase
VIPTHEAVFVDGTLKKVADGLNFAEGPCLTADGKLLVCDLGGGMIYRVDPSKATAEAPAPLEVFRSRGESPAGAAIDAEGRLVVAHFAGKLTISDADGENVRTLADACGGVKFSKCNDLVCLPSGAVYFTDFGGEAADDGKVSKGLFVRGAGAEGVVESVDTDYLAANGACYEPVNSVLYVAEYGAGKIYAYDVVEDRVDAKARRVFADFADVKEQAGRGKVDGLKVDEHGRVFTTGPGGVWVLSRTGERLAHLKVRGASNVCLGPVDAATGTRPLYITATRTVYAAMVKEP